MTEIAPQPIEITKPIDTRRNRRNLSILGGFGVVLVGVGIAVDVLRGQHDVAEDAETVAATMTQEFGKVAIARHDENPQLWEVFDTPDGRNILRYTHTDSEGDMGMIDITVDPALNGTYDPSTVTLVQVYEAAAPVQTGRVDYQAAVGDGLDGVNVTAGYNLNNEKASLIVGAGHANPNGLSRRQMDDVFIQAVGEMRDILEGNIAGVVAPVSLHGS